MIAVRRDGGTQLVGEARQDADNFSAFVTFKFSYAIVGFHYFGRLDEYGLPLADSSCTIPRISVSVPVQRE